MKALLYRLWNDEEGAEIAEWVVVVALLVAVAVVVYNTILQTQLTDLVNRIGDQVNNVIT